MFVERPKRVTEPFLDVAQALLAAGEAHGWAIGGDRPTVYAILDRMERMGWVTGRWEYRRRPGKRGSPVRRYYAMTEPGARAARMLLRERGRGRQLREAR